MIPDPERDNSDEIIAEIISELSPTEKEILMLFKKSDGLSKEYIQAELGQDQQEIKEALRTLLFARNLLMSIRYGTELKLTPLGHDVFKSLAN